MGGGSSKSKQGGAKKVVVEPASANDDSDLSDTDSEPEIAPRERRATIASVPDFHGQSGGMKKHTSTGQHGAAPANVDESNGEWDTQFTQGSEHGTLKIGMFSRVGDPTKHANEDRCTVVPDLLASYASQTTDPYAGDESRRVSYFGVYDGHGGNQCSETLKKKLHTVFAKNIWKENTEGAMKKHCERSYMETEVNHCKDLSAGACSVSVVLKGRKLWTANCGDCMAMVFKYDAAEARVDGMPVTLNDRHAVYLSEEERKRLLKSGQEVSEQVGLEDALISRDKTGEIYKAIYPSRSFGDGDFKSRTFPIKGLIAAPTGRGVAYEGEPYEFEGTGTWFLVVACDGLWDFMEVPEILDEMLTDPTDAPQQMAERLVKVCQDPKRFDSDDDVTVVVVRIDFD